MSFQLTILGSSSAAPAYGRHQSSQLLIHENVYFLIDCGEATQNTLIKNRLKPLRINHILISHLHGDHFLGVFGLLSSMQLFGRQNDIHIYAPKGLDDILTTLLRHTQSSFDFPVYFHYLKEPELIFENNHVSVHTVHLDHRLPCFGFVFREKKRPLKINKEKLPENISVTQIHQLKNGEDIRNEEGEVIHKNADITLPPTPLKSYAYCSDTRYDESLIDELVNIDTLYHEATFTHDKLDRAKATLHTTALEAGRFAKLANIKQLILGHFSIRYRDLNPLLEEAKTEFPNTLLAIEGTVFKI